MTPEIAAAVADEPLSEMMLNYQGVMLGRGEVWVLWGLFQCFVRRVRSVGGGLASAVSHEDALLLLFLSHGEDTQRVGSRAGPNCGHSCSGQKHSASQAAVCGNAAIRLSLHLQVNGTT